MILSSPNHMIWQYFEALRRLVNDLAAEQNQRILKQNVALAILLSVTVVEAFVNIFFRVLVSEDGFTNHKRRVLGDLNRRMSLDYKLKTWPKIILGNELNFEASIPKRFLDLKKRRNSLMHFTSTHGSFQLSRIDIHGLANTTVFDSLRTTDAAEALELAEGMICEFFRLRGVTEQQLKHALHAWTGKVPV